MSVGSEFKAHLGELLAPIGRFTIRDMFGGAGVFHEGVMFALIADEVLYLKVDDQTRHRFEAEGSQPFTYQTSGGRRQVMSYYEMPDHLFDEPDEFLAWMRQAIAAAMRARRRKPPARAGANMGSTGGGRRGRRS